MRLYILGKNTDDKGAQLEQLTKTILERQGYSNIVTNLQVAGGGEIDVTAKYVHQTGIRNNVQLVICECKAHEKPIDMNDWQKFIGKLLIARKTNQNAIGLMIALTGANGSVEGSKEKDFAGDNSVQLIANDDLIELLSQIYALPTRWSLKDTIISLIQRNDLYFDLNLLYYEYSLFWIAEVKGKFILLTKDGKLLSEQESKNILELLPNFTPYNPTQYWDILAERETERQLYEINRLVTEMILIMKKVEKSTLFSAIVTKVSGKEIPVHPDLLNEVISNNPLVIEEEEQIRFNDQIDRIEFYNYLLTYIGVKENIIKTDFYQNNINDDLLDQILQNGVVLNRENRQNCLFMMKHSPAALLCAILPNQLFSIAKFFSSIQTNEKNDEMKLMFENLFMEAISESFLKDFLNRDIKEVFNDIKEIQYERRINVLADKNYNISYHNRIGVLDPKEIPVDPE